LLTQKYPQPVENKRKGRKRKARDTEEDEEIEPEIVSLITLLSNNLIF
jgi:hypothetical protein